MRLALPLAVFVALGPVWASPALAAKAPPHPHAAHQHPTPPPQDDMSGMDMSDDASGSEMPDMDMGGMQMDSSGMHPVPRATASAPPVHEHGMAGMADMPMGGMHDPMAMHAHDPLAGSGTSWHPAASPMAMDAWTLGAWTVMVHGRAQVGWNHQGGARGGDGDAAENWMMLHAHRSLGYGQLELRAMASLEPATIPGGGEPQLLQTGETWQGQPLLDHQHPHTAFMELATRYSVPLSADAAFFAYAGPVGEPALGPEAFMHRASAGENPWAPLGHHLQDSTHISEGVISEGVSWRNWKFDASLFNAREPGENRWALTPGPLDSYSGRLTWNPDARWSIQVSAGHLTAPEALAPNDVVRTTASVTYDRPLPDGNLATSLVWGHNHEILAAPLELNGFLAEAAWDFARDNHLYTRGEVVDKENLAPGVPMATVGALTLGGVRDVWRSKWVVLGVGGDLTVDAVPASLQPAYGSAAPLAFQIYVRLAPPVIEAM